MFEKILEDAYLGEITPETALILLNESKDPEKALLLFKAASLKRDEKIGKELWWSAGISAVLPCNIQPRCNYCTFFAKLEFPVDLIVKTVKIIESFGIKQVHLSGGTDIQHGYDAEIIGMVEEIRKASAIDLEVNLGPSISRETIKRLRELKVTSITSSLESFNEKLFKEAKPGDSLEKRKELLQSAQEEGLLIRSMMMVGLGESNEDRINHLFYLRGFKNFCNLNFSRFNPFPGIPFSNHERCSPWEVARTVAVARLVLPSAELGLAAGNDMDDLPLWYLAGGGNKIMGASSTRKDVKPQSGVDVIPVAENLVVVNSMKAKMKYIEGMGRQVIFNVRELEKI